jgi:uncharacterized protein (TIGR02284 family)
MNSALRKSADILTRLLLITEDGKEGYKNAAENSEDPALKNIFEKCCEQRTEYLEQIKFQLQKLGDPQRETHCHLGDVHRKIQLKKIAGDPNDGNVLVKNCLSLDEANLEIYREAFYSRSLSHNVKLLVIGGQLLGIVQTIKHLRTHLDQSAKA